MPSSIPDRGAARRDAIINLRLAERERNLIDAAAEALGKTRTEFMLESARQHAIDVLLDRRLYELPPAQFDAFAAALAEPVPPTKALKKLVARKAPWEA